MNLENELGILRVKVGPEIAVVLQLELPAVAAHVVIAKEAVKPIAPRVLDVQTLIETMRFPAREGIAAESTAEVGVAVVVGGPNAEEVAAVPTGQFDLRHRVDQV